MSTGKKPIMQHFLLKKIAPLFLLLLLFPMAGQAQQTFLDQFGNLAYNNNDGTQNFSSNWIEYGDNNSPSGGTMSISGGRLIFNNIDGDWIERSLNLTGFSLVTLTLDYDATSRGGESLGVYLWDGSGYTMVANINSNATGSIVYNLPQAFIRADAAISFSTSSGNWGFGDEIRIDNVQFTASNAPFLSINDVAVNENAGTATFTVAHIGSDASGPFTVNYSTSNGTATAGADYTAASGTLSFNGTAGDTEQIVVPILNDSDFESPETFTVQLSGVSDGSVIITDTGTGTINDDEIVLGNTPLALFRGFDGYMDYTSTAGTLRTQPNNIDPCAITTSSSNTLSAPIPAGATVEAAYLYWAHSGYTMDTQVTFEGTTVNADMVYTTNFLGRSFYGIFSDVTSLVAALPDPSTNVYDFTDLAVETSADYCGTTVVLGGWTLMIFYSHPSLPASTINLYQGFDGNQNSSSTFSLSGFYAIGSVGAKTTALSWEGDQNLANNESLQFTTPLSGTRNLTGDGDNDGISANNPFNSTNFDNTVLPNVNNTALYGVDLDTYDVSSYILPGENTATTQVNVGTDFVVMNAVVLKVPSNLITGRVFEDLSYGGGAGRSYAASSGVGLPDATVELYDNLGTLVETKTTDANGIYVFAGMIDGSYTVRVVNESVRSSRGGGSGCASCLPVQTFKSDYAASTVTPNTNQVGGSNPAATDPGPGTLTGAQSVASVTILSEGAAGIDFGFNFNSIVNTNEDGQGSLEQFIVNANNLDQTGLDIDANPIFDPGVGEDVSIFMIPPTGDALGRSADANFNGSYFNIFISNAASLSDLNSDNLHVDGRTQTAYSGDTNAGSTGAGGTPVGVGATALPSFSLPEIQVHRNSGDVFLNLGTGNVIRNLAIYAGNNAGVLLEGGSLTLLGNLLGVDATGANAGAIDTGIEVNGGDGTIAENYLATNTAAGIWVQNTANLMVTANHFTGNGTANCGSNIRIEGGSGIVIELNLIENAQAVGIEADASPGGLTVDQNSITGSGQDTGCFSGEGGVAIRLGGSNSTLSGNVIYSNGNAGIVVNDASGTGNLITQNSIYANGTTADALGIDLDDGGAYGDGVTLNDASDADSGANGLLNFPVIQAAYIYGTNLIVKGWARPGSTVEVFFTDFNEGAANQGDNQLGNNLDYGEGQVYIGTFVEGSGADLDPGTSNYLDIDGNTDTTNLFEFAIPLPAGTSTGEWVTATASLANSTSEFGPIAQIKVRSVITNRRITYRVNPN